MGLPCVRDYFEPSAVIEGFCGAVDKAKKNFIIDDSQDPLLSGLAASSRQPILRLGHNILCFAVSPGT